MLSGQEDFVENRLAELLSHNRRRFPVLLRLASVLRGYGLAHRSRILHPIITDQKLGSSSKRNAITYVCIPDRLTTDALDVNRSGAVMIKKFLCLICFILGTASAFGARLG